MKFKLKELELKKKVEQIILIKMKIMIIIKKTVSRF